MIETKIISTAVGVQRGDVNDKTESTQVPSTKNGLIIGRFKRGRTDKPFKVTNLSYPGMLGRDINNPDYLTVEDSFNKGVSELWIYRIGESEQAS